MRFTTHMRFILISIFLLANGLLYAQNLFSYDEKELNIIMKDLLELEDYLSLNTKGENPELNKQGTILLSGLKDNPMQLVGLDEELYDIPPFYWGCLMSGLGVVIVYKTTADNSKTRQAFMGCLANGVFLTGVYVVKVLVRY